MKEEMILLKNNSFQRLDSTYLDFNIVKLQTKHK